MIRNRYSRIQFHILLQTKHLFRLPMRFYKMPLYNRCLHVLLKQRKNQRTIGPVSLTWVLRIYWIRTNLEIHEHSMLYKLSPIQKQQEQIWPCHKNGQGQPSVIIWKKKPQGVGIQPLSTSSGSILKLLLFPSFCTSSKNIPYASLFYMIFCFISYMSIKRQPLGTLFYATSKVLSLWTLVACFKTKALPSDFMHIFFFMILHIPWAGQTPHQGQNFDVNRKASSLCHWLQF